MANIAEVVYIVEGPLATLEKVKEYLVEMPYDPAFIINRIEMIDNGNLIVNVDSPWKENKEKRNKSSYNTFFFNI